MYIEYITPQRVSDPRFTKYKWPGNDYRPKKLIRTSDWKVVPGYEAINGYCTLSYSWEQSGQVFQKRNGEYDLEDKGYHQITYVKRRRGNFSIFQQERVEVETKQVKYEKVLQQICNDFGIDYLWYDKICINHSNKAEKHRETMQRHHIYNNARYTVAVVPELDIDELKEFSRKNWWGTKPEEAVLARVRSSIWWRRSWTLEELMLSPHMLIVGRNTHMWFPSETLNKMKFPRNKTSYQAHR